jgi:LPXTG-site transpeptidase (sortase) family protein
MQTSLGHSVLLRGRVRWGLFLLVLALVLGATALPFSPVRAATPAEEAVLVIPAIDVEAPIVPMPVSGNGWNIRALDNGQVGHLELTAWVGEGGNIVLAGHSETALGARDGVFASLHELEEGDIIIIRTGDTSRQYSVVSLRYVRYNDVSIAFPTRSEQLTLFTCALGTYSRQLGDYRLRLVVVATPVTS